MRCKIFLKFIHKCFSLQIIQSVLCVCIISYSSCRQRDVLGASIGAAWQRRAFKRRTGYWCCFSKVFCCHQRAERIDENSGKLICIHISKRGDKLSFARVTATAIQMQMAWRIYRSSQSAQFSCILLYSI